MNLYFYDFEVFCKNWMVVIINNETKEKTIIVDNSNELKEFYDLHKDDIWVGYNSRMYDQFILKGILLDKDPYVINKKLIDEGKNGHQIIKNANNIKFNNFDIATGFHGLKQLEAFMGSKIKETSVPFDIQRKLTDQEIQEVIEYCIHDVEQTIEVFNNRREEFDSQLSLIEAFNLDMGMFNKTKAQLSAYVLGTVKQDAIDDEFDFAFPNTLILSDKYKYIFDWYKNPKNMDYSKKLETMVANVPHTFAFGGIHGAIPNYVGEGIILCCDVASLYPSIMIEYGYISRNVTEPTKYKEIRDTRLKLKASKNPMQLPYKIVLNSTYGAMKDKHNPLYDPLMANNVCVAGQLLLLDLIEKIESYCELIQSNTDGLFMKVKDMETVNKIKHIAKEWENRTRLELEWDIYSKIYQKDVNNYIIINEKGKYKSKGAYVKKLNNIDYDLPIVNKALIDHFVSGTSIEDTINNCNKLREFQKIVKVSSLYKYALYGDEKLPEKTLRVFASNDKNAKGVFKVKTESRIEKIANTPNVCFVDNENILDKSVPPHLDKEYYIDMTKKRLDDFIDMKATNEVKVSDEQQIINLLNDNYEHFYDLLINIKLNTKITLNTLIKYVKIDVFKQYANAKKIIKYIEYFKLLYGKKNPKRQTLSKYIDDSNIIEIIKLNCEYNSVKDSFSKLNHEKCLKDVWDYLPNNDIHIIEKIKQQIDLYDNITIIADTEDINKLYVMNVNTNINPSIIAYCIKTGITQRLKINKSLFKILEIRVGDIIYVKGFDLKHGNKIIGKDTEGKNVFTEDTDKSEWWITEYDIIYRDYNKNDKLIIDDEVENY